jgi:hypothetical protein
MAAADELKTLIERTNRDLDDWSDFFEHTKAVWRGFEVWVGDGHKFEATNTATGRKFNEVDLVGLSAYYVTENLAPFVFQRFISVVEVFVFDFLRILLLRNPAKLRAKDVKFHVVLSKPDLPALIEGVIDHELNEVRYGKPVDWFAYINDVERLGCPSDDDIARIVEFKATRDVLEHNSGVVSKVYVDKAGAKARHREGAYIQIPDPYLRSSWTALRGVCNDMAAAAIKVLASK